MRVRGLTACAVVSLLLLGCDRHREVDCGGEETLSLVRELLQEDVTDKVRRLMSNSGYSRASSETLASSLAKIGITIEAIRTTSLDQEISSKACAGEVRIEIPQEMLDDADEALGYLSYTDVDELADVAGFRFRGRSFTRSVEYQVQPTDDSQGLYVKVADVSPAHELLANIVSAHLVLPEIRSAEAVQAAEAERRDRELNEASAAATAAFLAQANAEKTLSEQSINAVWAALADTDREFLLQVQRTWIRRKEAECRMQGASASIDASEQQAIAAQCETRYNRDRERYLRQYLSF
jgi:uncharacterized protein YecT (DUF1311 family)